METASLLGAWLELNLLMGKVVKILIDGIGGLGERLRFPTTFLILEFSEATFRHKFAAIYF